ncbi:catechol 2,3-dioxygenase-like lactoylglutathione lyase family enzyme [Conyzicola lurida]|uniref:Catechol 2,3-dioxygenase-like lactoylglutathione lyase family enzyme n=1 Tax=Conyzicola lurida TaxID=1172621 RepID=A0A841AL33_9MICO|nr:VOC family protein [Conyzicola lurida]MBB5843058.1 catechol 2,3-dioxygenase-like lactoylglutathione lyase family enzyme [Conyzicola lurida]
MSTETAVPLLPCRSLDESLAFYTLLGFEQTYRQDRPNPLAALTRGGLELQLFEIPGFVPEDSYGSILIMTSDTESLFEEFAAGLRSGLGKLPIAGIPRITRPRRKQGTAGGFSLVDPGGNWLRVFRRGESEQHETDRGLPRVLESAARQGDARGDDARAIEILEAGLVRYADAPAVERVPALVYRAELEARTGNAAKARGMLLEILDMRFSDEDALQLRGDLDAARELLDG